MGWADGLRGVPANLAAVAVRPVAAASRIARAVRVMAATFFTVVPAVLALLTEQAWLLMFTFLPIAVWVCWGAALKLRDAQVEADGLRGQLEQLNRRELRLTHINRPAYTIEPFNPEVRQYFPDLGTCHWMIFGIVNEGNRATLRTRLVRDSVSGVASQLPNAIAEPYPGASCPLRWPVHASEELVVNNGGDAQVDVAILCPAARRVRFLGPGMGSWMTMAIEPDVEEITGLIDIEDLTHDDKQRYAFRMLLAPVGFLVEPVAG